MIFLDRHIATSRDSNRQCLFITNVPVQLLLLTLRQVSLNLAPQTILTLAEWMGTLALSPVPGPPISQRATLKNWIGKATLRARASLDLDLLRMLSWNANGQR